MGKRRKRFRVKISQRALTVDARSEEDAIKKARKTAYISACLVEEYQCDFCKKECTGESDRDWHEGYCKENPERQKVILYRTIVIDLQNKLKRRFKDMNFERYCGVNLPMYINIYFYEKKNRSYENLMFRSCLNFNGKTFEVDDEDSVHRKRGEEFCISDPKYLEKIEEWVAEKKEKAEVLHYRRKARKKKNAKIQR